MTSDDSNYVLRIPTLNGASNYYVAYVKNGKITLTLNTPEIAITSCTCDNSDPNNLKQSDKLVLRATFKNTGAAHTLKTRLAIGTINESGKFGSIYRGPEKSTYVSSNGQITVVHEYSLADVSPGSYIATVQYCQDWDDNKWYYYENHLCQITVKESPTTPIIAITSCVCDNSNPNNLTQSDKLVLRATFKNTGAEHTLKTRLGIGTINESGKFGSIYRGPEKSTYISSNGQVTIVHEYNLTNVTPGSYVTTILWYEDWADGDNNGWYYNTTVPLKWTNRSLK